MSSSQLTNSYFSGGQVYHQPVDYDNGELERPKILCRYFAVRSELPCSGDLELWTSALQLRMESAAMPGPGSTRQRACQAFFATMPHSECQKECQNRCHIQNVRWNVQIFFTHTHIYIFTYIYIYMYVYLLIICHTYFQMICQKLCRNNLSGLRSRYYPSKRLGMAHTLW